jgi:aryl-alcohol dehydrogenase-like predicted oxidoreductase
VITLSWILLTAALAHKKGMSLATLAQAWAASRWYMASVIIGATTLEQVNFCVLPIQAL